MLTPSKNSQPLFTLPFSNSLRTYHFWSRSSQAVVHRIVQQSLPKNGLCRKAVIMQTQVISNPSLDREHPRSGTLILEDGTRFEGKSFGYQGGRSGEVVFSTGMVGYPEAITDASFAGQLLILTYPLVGNYGVPARSKWEDEHIHIAGLIVSNYIDTPFHAQSTMTLASWLQEEQIPALETKDTRLLTQHIRKYGAMLGKIVFDEDIPFYDPDQENLIAQVSTKHVACVGTGPKTIALIDCGAKRNIVRCLLKRDVQVITVPWDWDLFAPQNDLHFDGIIISNGPGNPKHAQATIRTIHTALERAVPTLGICMGNQLLTLAAGGDTYKMKFGHRSQNQPCVMHNTQRCYITTQNHGFAVGEIPEGFHPWFSNANDKSNEGIMHTSKPFMSVQFHLRLLPGENVMTQVHKVLVLGSGALKIGQAGEFDYSGSQALKALKEEGVQTILINPNIATIQTSQMLADRVYFLPVTLYFVERIIAQERPDGILLAFGGQTALNCGIELHEQGVLEKYQVAILGTPISAIILSEDRQSFAEHLRSIAIPTPQSQSATSLQDALAIGERIGFPVMVRAGFALGGQGSGIAHNREELEHIVVSALSFAPQVLIEQYLHHYKEVECEVVRDRYDNCITVCNMENMDPLGIHTGESIVVAPSQTLTNEEYHRLRAASISIVHSLGIVGECNVQFALDPVTSAYYVIEVNARLSRSSALASKVTGYPLAYIAAKLSLGYGLTELPNKVTGVTQACFEPSLDYLVVKIPRWDNAKFKGVNEAIGTSMKSVGEVMGIGRTFEEAYQKAIRMLEQNFTGAVPPDTLLPTTEDVDHYLSTPTPKRIFAIAKALQQGYDLAYIYELTGIDPWFLQRIKHIVESEEALKIQKQALLTADALRELKQLGISDRRIAELSGQSELAIRAQRKQFAIVPSVLQIDTLSAEFPSDTNYLYLTYNAHHNDVQPYVHEGVIVPGSGPYHIGSSVEFDWTSVSTGEALKRYGKKAIIINCNPETVSTDYDVSDRLYFEELTFERIADIYDFEMPDGLIVSVGGQTPNNRAQALHAYGCRLLGTQAQDIDRAEDRSTFSQLLDTLSVKQPQWDAFSTIDELAAFAQRVGYPVLVRPSYVLSGSAMKVCDTLEELEHYTRAAARLSPAHPVTVSKFFEYAREVEFDAVAQHGKVKAFVISEHIENAGVHSGDATIVLPPQTISLEIQNEVVEIGRRIAAALSITGPYNIQFLVKDGQVYVIETNLRASRTFPFISKVTGVNFIDLFVDALFVDEIEEVPIPEVPFTAIKAPQFSFARLTDADPMPGVEMASTGEVACFGEDVEEAYLKAIIATGGKVPEKGIFLSLCGEDKHAALEQSLPQLQALKLPLYATAETWQFLRTHDIAATLLHQPGEEMEPDIRTCFRNQEIDLAIVVVTGSMQRHLDEYYVMRRMAVDSNIQLITKIKQMRLFLSALVSKDLDTLPLKAWDEYHVQTPVMDALQEKRSLTSTHS